MTHLIQFISLCVVMLCTFATNALAQNRFQERRMADIEYGMGYNERMYLVSNYSRPTHPYAERLNVAELLDRHVEGFYFYLKQDVPSKQIMVRKPDGGFMPFTNALNDIANYLAGNDSAIITLFLDYNIDLDIKQCFSACALADKLYDYSSTNSWPTLQEMVKTGKRLVAFGVQRHVGSPSWLHSMSDHVEHSDPDWGGYAPTLSTDEDRIKHALTLFTNFKNIEARNLGESNLYEMARHTTYLVDAVKNQWIAEGRIPNFLLIDRYGDWIGSLQNNISVFNLVYCPVTTPNNEPIGRVNWEGMNNATAGICCLPLESGNELMLAPNAPGYNVSPEKRYATGNERRIYMQPFRVTPKNIDEALEISLQFDGDSKDYSRNNYTLTDREMNYKFDLAHGQLGTFNGKARVNLPPAAQLKVRDHDFTVQAWVKIPKFIEGKSDYCILGSKNSAYQQSLHLLIRNQKPYMGFYNNDIEGTTTIEENKWYHIVWRYNKNNGEQSIFVNGKLDNQATGRAGYMGSDSLFVGYMDFSKTAQFIGEMDQLAIWSRTLGDKEILALSNQLVEIKATPQDSNIHWYAIYAALVAALAALYIIWSGRRNRHARQQQAMLATADIATPNDSRQANNVEPQIEAAQYPTCNRVLLFGNFEVTDKDGNDITQQFTPKLKQLFILLLINSANGRDGISGKDISTNIWGEDSKNVKSVRSVSMLKLRKILERLDKMEVVFAAGKYVLQSSSNVHCDYAEWLALAGKNKLKERKAFEQFYQIIIRGEAFKNESFSWLDDTKSYISNTNVDMLCQFIGDYDIDTDSQRIIEIADRIMVNDPVNDEALAYKVKALSRQNNFKQARYTYEKFCAEYQNSYAEAYGISFEDIVNKQN